MTADECSFGQNKMGICHEGRDAVLKEEEEKQKVMTVWLLKSRQTYKTNTYLLFNYIFDGS